MVFQHGGGEPLVRRGIAANAKLPDSDPIIVLVEGPHREGRAYCGEVLLAITGSLSFYSLEAFLALGRLGS